MAKLFLRTMFSSCRNIVRSLYKTYQVVAAESSFLLIELLYCCFVKFADVSEGLFNTAEKNLAIRNFVNLYFHKKLDIDSKI